MKIYGIKTCDTCRKARKALPEADFVDVREDGLPAELLQDFWDSLGEALLNKRSTTWKTLSEEARSGDPLALISANPTLMKRPVIDANGQLYLGWTAAVQAKLLGTGG